MQLDLKVQSLPLPYKHTCFATLDEELPNKCQAIYGKIHICNLEDQSKLFHDRIRRNWNTSLSIDLLTFK